MRKHFLLSTLSFVVFLFVFGSQFLRPANSATSTQTKVPSLTLMAPMRDEVKLSTNVYLPEGEGPWPIVLVRTPYGKSSQTRSVSEWTKRGFAYVVQDCRGTFQSEGKYRPFVDDGVDGFDTIEWIAKQS